MKNHSKRKRHYSHQCGRQFVNNFNGLRYYPTYDTEININGENSKVDVTTHLRTFPMSDLVDVTSLEKLKGKMDISSEVPLNTTLAPVLPPSSQQQKPTTGPKVVITTKESKPMWKKILGFGVATILAIGLGLGGYHISRNDEDAA